MTCRLSCQDSFLVRREYPSCPSLSSTLAMRYAALIRSLVLFQSFSSSMPRTRSALQSEAFPASVVVQCRTHHCFCCQVHAIVCMPSFCLVRESLLTLKAVKQCCLSHHGIWHDFCAIMRPVLWIADFILGVRMLISASNGHCAVRGSSNCRVHFVLGAVLLSASLLDLMIAIAFIHFFHHMCMHLNKITRKVLHCLATRTCPCNSVLFVDCLFSDHGGCSPYGQPRLQCHFVYHVCAF
jgi:hypothetical protein